MEKSVEAMNADVFPFMSHAAGEFSTIDRGTGRGFGDGAGYSMYGNGIGYGNGDGQGNMHASIGHASGKGSTSELDIPKWQ